MLNIENLFAGYYDLNILKGISISIKPSTLTAIIGRNGCGKSTLLSTLAQQIKPISGRITLDDQPIASFNPREYARKLAYLHQRNDVPAITVHTLALHGRFPYLGFPRKASYLDKEASREALIRTSMWDLRDRPLSTLSGGERQRAFLAMALAQATPLILLDEPTTGLDISHQLGLMALLTELASEGKTIIAVLHDLDSAIRFSDRICLIDDGKCVFHDSPAALLKTTLIDDIFGVTVSKITIENESRILFGMPNRQS